jgi:hypothetical protein
MRKMDSIFRFISVLLFVYGSVDALGYTPAALTKTVRRRQQSLTPLYGGWFDFKPIHGGGSGGNQDFIDEQWEAQQAILRARRGEGQIKDDLKNKYKTKRQFEVKASAPPPPNVDSAMYFADQSSSTSSAKKATTPPASPKKSSSASPQMPAFKFPWDK